MTSPSKDETKTGTGVGGDEEREHNGQEPENAPVDTILAPAKAQGAQLSAAPTATKVKKNSRQRISDEKLEGMSAAEIRAVATDRGYKTTLGGRSGLAAQFKKDQEADESLEASEE